MQYIEADREAADLPADKPVPWWAEAAWTKGRDSGVLSDQSDPDAVIDTKRLAVFLDRLGLLDA